MEYLSWINYLSMVIGALNFLSLSIITTIVLRRNPKEKINWLFAMSFFFISIAFVFLPMGAFTFTPENSDTMVLLTKIYALTFVIGLVLLALSAVAFNYGTKFVFKWFILTPSLVVIAIIAVLLFAFNDVEGVWYSARANPDGSIDVQTSLLFTVIFYPILGIIGIVIYYFFIKAYKQTEDELIKRSLKLFLIGISVSVSMLIPNILSNVLANVWENAQILNALEFILVTAGITLMLIGFLAKPGQVKQEAITQVPVL